MDLFPEIIEVIFAILPGLLAVVVASRTPKKVYGWAAWVLGPVLQVRELALLVRPDDPAGSDAIRLSLRLR